MLTSSTVRLSLIPFELNRDSGARHALALWHLPRIIIKFNISDSKDVVVLSQSAEIYFLGPVSEKVKQYEGGWGLGGRLWTHPPSLQPEAQKWLKNFSRLGGVLGPINRYTQYMAPKPFLITLRKALPSLTPSQ